MNKDTYTCKAFTLMEITVALLIAAICMGIAYYVLNSFITIGLSQQREKKKEYHLHLFQNLLQQECLNSSKIKFIDQELTMERKDYLTSYLFMDSLIIRSQNGVTTDTIYGATHDFIPEYIEEIAEKPLKKLYFNFQSEYGLIPIVLYKDYSAAELINLSNK